MCFFVDEWECPFEGDEIPLEVCNTCIRARNSQSSEPIKVKTPSASSTERRSKSKKKTSLEPEMKEEEEDLEEMEEELKKDKLKELDRKFNTGKLTVDEYIEKRKELNL